MPNYVDSEKQFLNFTKAQVMYDMVTLYLAPQIYLLGCGIDNTDAFLSQNHIAYKMKQKN